MRIAWLDGLRGVTMFLVVFHHIVLDFEMLPAAMSSETILDIVRRLDSAVAIVRMPAFFLCSGILFAITMGRGWRWYIRERLWFMVWVVAIWTLLYFVMIDAGFHLFPRRDPLNPVLWGKFLWEPFAQLWFLYAIGILGAFALAINAIPQLPRLIAVYLISAAALLWTGLGQIQPSFFNLFPMLPEGTNYLASNIVARGALFFCIGCAFSRYLIERDYANFRWFAVSLAVLLICIDLVWRQSRWHPGFAAAFQFQISIPATFAFMYCVIYLLNAFKGFGRIAAAFGRISLEVFLLHQIFIGAAYLLLDHAGLGWDRGLYMLISQPVVVLLAVIAASVLRLSGFEGVFQTPRPRAGGLVVRPS